MGLELKQLVGTRRSRRGPREIRQPIDIVYRDGLEVAQVARHNDAPIVFTSEGKYISDQEREDIINGIEALRSQAENELERWTIRRDKKYHAPPTAERVDAAVAARQARKEEEEHDELERELDEELGDGLEEERAEERAEG